MLPKQKEMEIPLLEVLLELGGQGKPSIVYPHMTGKFPMIEEDELTDVLPSGANRWTNSIQWVRQALVEKGEVDSPARGIWRITSKGRSRVSTAHADESEPEPLSFLELYEEYEAKFRGQLLAKLQDLLPREFEHFARRLLTAYGFVDVTVTDLSKDGGIDGYGKLRLGLATMNVAFQCKRWQGNVGRPEVDKFRGAIQGAFEQGVFFTTANFTSDARDASLRRGAVPVILLNGERIVGLMIEKGLGVQRVPLYAYYERPSDFGDLGQE